MKKIRNNEKVDKEHIYSIFKIKSILLVMRKKNPYKHFDELKDNIHRDVQKIRDDIGSDMEKIRSDTFSRREEHEREEEEERREGEERRREEEEQEREEHEREREREREEWEREKERDIEEREREWEREKEERDEDFRRDMDKVKEKYAPSKSGCFIATAAYGTSLATEIDILRKWRDNTLMKNYFGIYFVRFYYFVSPPIAAIVCKSEILKKFVRFSLNPIIKHLKNKS